MKVLALDAVTEACSAALWIDGEVRERYAVAPREHTRLLLPMVDELLQEADLSLGDLDRLAFDRGPGSFTGIRITLSVMQGLAFARDLPVAPVSSLAALAWAACHSQNVTSVLSLIDARMGELYWGYYRCEDGAIHLQGEEQVCALASIPWNPESDWSVVGSGVMAYADSLRQHGFTSLIDDEALRYPRATAIAELAAQATASICAVDEVEPVYLRNKVTA